MQCRYCKAECVKNGFYKNLYGECYSCGTPDITTIKHKNNDSAFYYLRKAACHNEADAYFSFGNYYLKGYKNIIAPDSIKAACCFNKAFEFGKTIPAYSDNIEFYLEKNIGSNWKEWLTKKEDEACGCDSIIIK